jgi:hypothetical protein
MISSLNGCIISGSIVEYNPVMPAFYPGLGGSPTVGATLVAPFIQGMNSAGKKEAMER